VTGVTSVRIGRRVELEVDDPPDLEQLAELADQLLANPVIEDYSITIPEDSR
jgi:phosphoribosylformylglycinamidine synthase